MKIIETMKDNYKKHQERETEIKKLKDVENKKKDLELTDNDINDIIKLIAEQNPAWAELDPDILKLMFKWAMKKYKPKEEDFDLSDRAALKQKIADIFNNSDKITFAFSGQEVSAGNVTPDEIRKLNAAYLKGKSLGTGFTKGLKSVFKKKIKNI